MRRGSAVAFAALALLGLLGADAPRSAPPAHLLRVSPGLISSTVPATPVTPVAPVTIEPTLPLLINLKLTGQHGGAQGGVARLEVSLDAGAPLDDVALILVLPDGLKAEDGPLARGLHMPLAQGEHRGYIVPLSAGRAGRFPVRVHAAFRLADGRSFETNQASLLSLGVTAPEGRSNAGAYEFMGVPQEELPR